MERVIVLKRDMPINKEVWKARRYKVPGEMSKELADWLLEKRPDIAELVSSVPPTPERIEVGERKPDPIEYMQEAMTEAQKFKKEGIPTPQKTAFDKLLELVGSDLIEIFGDYGTGKSRLVGHIALEAQEAGKEVLYLDDENSLPRSIIAKLNYQYVGINLDKIIERVASIEDHYDLVCLDSIGFPVLIDYVRLSLREQLRAIQKMILLRGYLKDYAIRNKGLAIVTNQPQSEYAYASGKVEEHEPLNPFGGKGAFISKLLLRTNIISRGASTKIGIRTFKARDMPFDKQIAEFVISNDKTELRWL